MKTVSEAKEHFKKHDRTRSFEIHASTVHSVSWNSDGRRLASGSVDKNVCVANLETTRLRTEFTCRGHTDQVDQVSWHVTNPELLASASGDKSIRVWDVRAKKGAATIVTKGQNINVGWSPDGGHVAFGDKDDKISVVDTRTWKIRHTESFKDETNEFAWEPAGRYFFVASGQGRVFMYKFPEMKLHLTLQAHPLQALCVSIKIDPMGRHFAVGGGDALITVWDLPNLACVRTIDRMDWPVRAVSFSHDGRLLAAGSEDHCIDIAWVETADRVFDLKSEKETYTMAWHPKEYLLAFACEDRPALEYNRARETGLVKLFGLSGEQL